MLSVDQKHFELIGPTPWEEVFAAWRNNEAHQERWITHYQNRGFKSWDEWRSKHTAPLKLNKRTWFLYKLVHPLEIVPTFWGGPFKSWKKYYYGENASLPFAKLASLTKIETNTVINELASNFPSSTTLIGLLQNDKIIIGEGMHRCCALALAAQRGQNIEPEIFLALTDFSNEIIPPLEQVEGD